MSLLNETIQFLKEQRNNILEGKVNCIPSPFTRFRKDFPGVQPLYYIVSGATKSAKTQLANKLFVYTPIEFDLTHPGVCKPKIFYVPLEETPRSIVLRYYAYILYKITNGKVIISPTDLKSIDERKPLSQEILDLMETEEFIKYANAFEECVEFLDVRNPTGIYKYVRTYLDANGTTEYEDYETIVRDEFGNTRRESGKKFLKYTPNNPNTMVILLTDHVGLLAQEGNKTLKETIERHSEYEIILRNRYSVCSVHLQQQNTESTNLEAFKANKIRPTKDGLKESKRPGEDCSMMIGITNPTAYELPSYAGYDLKKFKEYFRIIEIVLAREGRANGLCPLFFNGANNQFFELPKPNDLSELGKVYNYIDSLRQEEAEETKALIDKSSIAQKNTLFLALSNIKINNIVKKNWLSYLCSHFFHKKK